MCYLFQSTPPRRRATLGQASCSRQRAFQSTPPRRRATRALDRAVARDVSIHAPPEEGDQALSIVASASPVFQSTPPRRRATMAGRRQVGCTLFQSTPPRRRATWPMVAPSTPSRFNPRPPGGGRRRTELRSRSQRFQSTPPRRRATSAPRQPARDSHCFNPRPPGGGRPMPPRSTPGLRRFNPRPPGGGRRRPVAMLIGDDVSIHAPPEEGDHSPGDDPGTSSFNPRPPGGGRPRAERPYRILCMVSIHAPPEEGDQHHRRRTPTVQWFQSTPPRRRATHVPGLF